MEVEGVIREIEGDTGRITVKLRDNGNLEMTNQIQIQVGGKGNFGKEEVVIDPKRRRVNESFNGENIGEDNMQT